MIPLPNITGVLKVGKTFLLAHRPELLLGTSITATIGSVVLAAKGGYEAGQKVTIEEHRHLDLFDPQDTERTFLDTKDKVRLTWPCYVPAAVATVGALGATTGLHIVHIKDKKAMAAAGLAAIEEVKASAQQYAKDVQDTLDDSLTEKQKEKVQNNLDERRADAGRSLEPFAGDGEVTEMYLVRDGRTGRDIYSNATVIEDAINEVNNVINGQGNCDVNTFYSFAGFNTLADGEEYGWSGALVTLDWKGVIRDDGRPVREFTFRPAPEKDFGSWR